MKPHLVLRIVRAAPVRATIGVFVLAYLLVSSEPDSALSLRNTVPQAALALVAIAAALLCYVGLVRFLELRFPSELVLRWQEIALGLLAGAGLTTIVAAILWLRSVPLSLLFPITPFVLLSALIQAIRTGVLEELLYRGVLQRYLSLRFGNIFAVVGTAVIFGVTHAQGSRLDATIAGIALGAAFLATGRLWLPISIHIANNFVESLIVAPHGQWRLVASPSDAAAILGPVVILAFAAILACRSRLASSRLATTTGTAPT